MSFAAAVTDLGDLFVAGLVTLAVTIWLWRRLNGLTAMAFAMSFGAGLTIATTFKFFTRDYFYEPALSKPFELSSGAPSGHAVLAGLLYGGLLGIFLQVGRTGARVVGSLLCVSAILAVTITRVTLHTHTIADVLAGMVIAALGSALFSALLFNQRPEGQETWSLLAVVVAVALLTLASGIRISSAGLL